MNKKERKEKKRKKKKKKKGASPGIEPSVLPNKAMTKFKHDRLKISVNRGL